MRLRPGAFSGRRRLAVRDVDLSYRVPLIIYAPGRVKPRRLQLVASQIDLAPTVLELLGVRTDNAFMGVSLLGPTPPGRRFAIMGDENGWSILFSCGTPEEAETGTYDTAADQLIAEYGDTKISTKAVDRVLELSKTITLDWRSKGITSLVAAVKTQLASEG